MQNDYLPVGFTMVTGAAAEFMNLSEYLIIIILMIILIPMVAAIISVRKGSQSS